MHLGEKSEECMIQEECKGKQVATMGKIMHYLELYRRADPKTKSFIWSCFYLFLLIAWSATWPYFHVYLDRTNIPRQETHESAPPSK